MFVNFKFKSDSIVNMKLRKMGEYKKDFLKTIANKKDMEGRHKRQKSFLKAIANKKDAERMEWKK